MKLSLILAGSSFILMLVGYGLARFRYVHIPIMLSVLMLDLAMPFYLYQTGDWVKRLFDQGEIVSFLLWMHLGLVISLYVLFGVQIQTALALIKGDEEKRIVHRQQGQAALLVKGLVVLTGAILIK